MKISPITDRPRAEKIDGDAEFLIVQKKENGEKGTFLTDAKKLADHISTDAMKEQADRAETAVKSVTVKAAEDESGKSIPRTAVFEGNKVYTKGGVSLGQNTTAGGKCFILRSGKKETNGCSLVVGFMTDAEFNTLSGLVAGGLYVSARLDYNFDGHKVTKIEKVTDGKVADGDVRFTLDSELRVVTGKNWYAESNFPDRLTANKAACVSVGTNTPKNTVKTATLWIVGHPEVGTFGINELVDTDGNIVSADARGYKTSAVNIGAFAAGRNSNASGKYSAVFGDNNNAGYAAFAAGKRNTAYPECSVALGQGCVAGGINAVATGFRTKCNSENGFTSGLGTKTTNKNEVAVGSFNVSSSDTLFSIGNGADNSRRKNAFEVKQNGDVYIEGKGYAGSKELADKESVNSEMKRQSNRLSNLESAISGKITETVTFADKIEAKGRTLPAAVLPYARLNRIGGITKATSVTANGVKTWTDTPSDIKYIRTRGYNQGGVIKDVTTNPFHVKLETKGSADTKYYDYSYATECTLTEDGKLRIYVSEYYLNLQKGDKIRITINSSTVDGATFVGGSLEKVPVTTNTSGSVYVFENAKDYLYVYPPTQNVDNYLINNAAARIYGDKAYVGDISYIGYNAGKEWTAKNPNETYNWRVTEYYYDATVKEDNASHLDWTIPLGVFNYDPTENMTAEEKQAFNPQTDFKKYRLPADCYRPYEESITALPDTDKPLHGFDKNYSNWLTFGDDGTVDYTDNYVKYVCNILKYESFYGSTNEYYFSDATVTVPLSDAGWAGMTATNKISWDHWHPDYTDLRVTDGTSVEEMTTYLSENKGLFAARTKMNSNGETITTEKVADGYSPYIPVYEKGIIQLLDSNKKPTDGILDITYQTKKTEA